MTILLLVAPLVGQPWQARRILILTEISIGFPFGQMLLLNAILRKQKRALLSERSYEMR